VVAGVSEAPAAHADKEVPRSQPTLTAPTSGRPSREVKKPHRYE
jgi:hypothetical protein